MRLSEPDKVSTPEEAPHISTATKQTINRRHLLAATLGSRNVTDVDIREITLAPGQQSGRHLHPCAVVGYIASGNAHMQIEGSPVQTLPTGSAFYEPASVIITNFGNASETESMTFIAVYLLDGKQDLIQMM
ncbi:cupin domain-containing protein [Acidicapsa dinghuensis]|uniref:Cupin domain-containing protein n=1 Tax=Acidicapsa dinghuensis TaxID=2218256 RepID=A0ABW1EB22_9BACT|nr:cupin domain-containing protein [Acidicapsa dinghuensis]